MKNTTARKKSTKSLTDILTTPKQQFTFYLMMTANTGLLDFKGSSTLDGLVKLVKNAGGKDITSDVQDLLDKSLDPADTVGLAATLTSIWTDNQGKNLPYLFNDFPSYLSYQQRVAGLLAYDPPPCPPRPNTGGHGPTTYDVWVKLSK